jgi:hypothetical protein
MLALPLPPLPVQGEIAAFDGFWQGGSRPPHKAGEIGASRAGQWRFYWRQDVPLPWRLRELGIEARLSFGQNRPSRIYVARAPNSSLGRDKADVEGPAQEAAYPGFRLWLILAIQQAVVDQPGGW